MAESINNVIYKIEVDTKNGQVNIDGLTKGFIQADKAVLKLQKDIAKGTSGAAKSMKGLGDATGSATSATMELSRVISDAPYGIRGMANNITQLVSQLGTASTKAGGLTGALKLMGKQLMGPLGIVFAITAAVSALDFFFGAATKASSSASDYAESLVSLTKTMDDLKISQEDVNDKIEDYIVLSDLKNKLDKSQEKSTERLKEIEEDLASFRENNAKKQKKLLLDMTVAEYEALSEEEKMAHRRATKSVDFDKRFKQLKKDIKEEGALEDEKRLIISQSIDIQKEYNDAKKKFNAAEEGTLQALKNAKKEKEKERELLSKTSEEYKRLTVAIDEYQRKIEEIEGKKTKGSGEDKKISPFKTPKELDIDIKNAENAIIQYEKKIKDARLKEEMNEKMSLAKTEEEKKKIRQNYEKDRLINQINAEKLALELKRDTELKNAEIKTDSHVDDLKRIYDKYLFELELNDKLSEKDKSELKADATGKFIVATSQAEEEQAESVREIGEKYNPLFLLFNKLGDARLSALFSGFGDEDNESKLNDEAEKIKERQRLLTEIKLQALADAAEAVTGFLNGEFQREIDIEKNKTNALNNELNKRLLNENLSKDERKRIQLQIGANDEKLRIKQEQIEKKRFKLNKAANISQALLSTYLAVAQVQANPLDLNPVTKGISMAATLAMGLANVATLARQKFQSSAGSGGQIGGGFGGGSGSGGNDRDFNFNLAGTSQQNQLAQTLQGQFSQPLQAYVVSTDITNQQQLDQEILGNATFG